MTLVPSGSFRMGSEDFYPEEGPVREVEVGEFWIDERPVTAAEYRRFVREPRYVTVAERPLDPADYPDADPDLLVPGSVVFRKTGGPVPLNDHRNWWEYVPGASWKRPGGPGTSINGRDNHPVVQVTCLRTNEAMRRLAQKAEARMVLTFAEAAGEIHAPRPTAMSWLREAFVDAFDTVIYTMRWPIKDAQTT